MESKCPSQSSVLSNVSVSVRGSEMNIEQALDESVRGLQTYLNDLQLALRAIAVGTEQQTDDGLEDLKQSVEQSDRIIDDVIAMNELFNDLVDIADQLVYTPETPEEKSWLSSHKAERKTELAERKKKEVERRKLEKAELKAKVKEEKKLSAIKE